jgi:lipopolysaccharide transport protein LptA
MKVLTFFLLLIFSVTKFEELKTKKGPVHIKADKMTILKKEQKIVFEGNVSLKREDIFVTADVAEVNMDEKFENIKRIIARGNVKAIQGDRNAKCGRLEYIADKEVMRLTLNPVIWTKNGVVSGEVIIVHIESEVIEVEKAVTTVEPSK